MSEAGLWRHMRKGLTGLPATVTGGARYVDLMRVENAVMEGVPDVNYCLGAVDGWVELKFRREWPKRARTNVTIDHYTQEQRDWLRARGRAGGAVWVLLQVDATYMLFHWLHAVALVGLVPRDVLLKHATATWEGKIDFQQLWDWLRSNTGAPPPVTGET